MRGNFNQYIFGMKNTVLEELVRLNRSITDCESTLRFLRSAKDVPQSEIQRLEILLEDSKKERDWWEKTIAKHSQKPLEE